jgi:hypothetical protein
MVKILKKAINKRLPKGVRKYIAQQKAIIRRTFSDNVAIDEKIRELYSRMPKHE